MTATISRMSSHLLERWIPYARKHLHAHPNNPDFISYGLGHSASWSLQSNNTAAGAFAVLALDEGTDTSVTGMSRDEMLHTAVAMVRFWAHTHLSGHRQCTDLKPWGHTWISALCTERVMHVLQDLDGHLTDEDRAAVARLHASEADWLLTEYPVTCGLRQNNHPESNLWNGALMHRAALLNPASANVTQWHDRALDFFVNAISIPADAESQMVVEGKALAERHVGPNCTPDFEMFHHNYLNVGYMVICLSNLAMAHFWLKRKGVEPPAALYHHAEELWRLVKLCTFSDGRLCRIGGDTRVRYTYCQDYALPAWHWVADTLGDADVTHFQQGWLRQVEVDMDAASDDSFLGGRLGDLAKVSPLYRLRLEGDKAATLSMAASWNAIPLPLPESQAPDPTAVWHGRDSGSVLVRGPKRLASMVWNGGECPTALVLPENASDWAEWSGSLTGRVNGMGGIQDYPWTATECRVSPNGFFNRGAYTVHEVQFVAEGDQDRDTARVEVAMTALDDGRTVIVAQRAVALMRDWFQCVKGLYYQLPNDIFNGSQRTVHTAAGAELLHAPGDGKPFRSGTYELGNWLNVEGKLSIVAVSGGPLSVHRPAARNIGIRPHLYGGAFARVLGKGQLRCEELCQGPCITEPTVYEKDAVLFDTLTVLRTDDTQEETEAFAAALATLDATALSAEAWAGTLTALPKMSATTSTK